MVSDNFSECPSASTSTNQKRRAKPLTARLRKSKNFWKEDRSLDDYIDRNKAIKSGEKLLLKKLLKLRTNEDSNEVVVTKSGLTKLLDVNIKTVREWINKLIRKGFLIDDGDVWLPHKNFPLHRYKFPDSFPGFDSATVFIQKGAKAKYKKKMANPAKARAIERKVEVLAPKITCPVSDGLSDCSNSSPNEEELRTCNSFRDTIVSPKEITESSAQIAPQVSARRLGSIKKSRIKIGTLGTLSQDERMRRKQGRVCLHFLDLFPELKSLLRGVLRTMGAGEKINHFRRYIDQLIKVNPYFRTNYDLDILAEILFDDLHLEFVEKHRTRRQIGKLYRFLRLYITNFCTPSLYKTDEYYQSSTYNMARYDLEAKIFKEFPEIERSFGWKIRPDVW